MIIDINAQAELIIQEIKRTYSTRMIFKLDDLSSYKVAKSYSNFSTLNNLIKRRIFEIAYAYGTNTYKMK